MELLRSYGKRSRADSVAYVNVVSSTTIRYAATFIDLRSGLQKSTRSLDLLYAPDGRILRSVSGKLHVVHPDGRSVEMQFAEASVHQPTFVGDALVVQDSQLHKLPFGVFDCGTGALRGRLEHAIDPAPLAPGMILAALGAASAEELWITDVSSLRCWNTSSVTCTRGIKLSDGHRCTGLARTAAGNLVTGLRPFGGGRDDDELVVVDGSRSQIIARRKLAHGSFARAGAHLAVVDDRNKRLLLLDDALEERAEVAMPPDESSLTLMELWSGEPEILAIDWHNRVHHYGPPALAPPNEAEAPRKPGKPKK